MIEAQELAKKLGPNFKQNRIQTMVDQWMTWKANEVLHGGTVALGPIGLTYWFFPSV